MLNPLVHPICLMNPRRLTPFSALHEHIPFAMFLVDVLKPKVILKLGTYYGNFYHTFHQAVKELLRWMLLCYRRLARQYPYWTLGAKILELKSFWNEIIMGFLYFKFFVLLWLRHPNYRKVDLG